MQVYFQELTPEIYSSPWGPLSRQLSCWWNQVRSRGWSCCKDMLVSWLPSGHSLTLSPTRKYQCLFPRWRCFPLDSPSVWTSARRRVCMGPVEMVPQWLQEAYLGHSCLLVYRQVGVEVQMWRHLQEAVKIQFSSVTQLCLILWPQGMEDNRLPCLSPTPRANSNSCPSCWWCHPTISFSVVPFSSCLQSFPASWSFHMSLFFTSRG